MKAYASNIRISPKKVAVVATIIRNMEVQKALDILKFMPNK
jgi:ribosomal protein L22